MISLKCFLKVSEDGARQTRPRILLMGEDSLLTAGAHFTPAPDPTCLGRIGGDKRTILPSRTTSFMGTESLKALEHEGFCLRGVCRRIC